jgi:hypothetical protein
MNQRDYVEHNIHLFCRNADGEIVILSKVWLAARQGKAEVQLYAARNIEGKAAVSLYAARGIKDKALRLVHREFFDKSTHTKDMLNVARDTVAFLWAMHFGVSNFVVVYDEPKMSELYHPTQLKHLSKEKQP